VGYERWQTQASSIRRDNADVVRDVNHLSSYSAQVLVAEDTLALGAHDILVKEQASGFYDAAFGLVIVSEEGE
jgi:hypothetical protein